MLRRLHGPRAGRERRFVGMHTPSVKQIVNLLHGLILLVVLFGLTGTTRAEESPLVGRWTADVRTQGGLGTSWTFTDDGQVTRSFGALVDFKYEIHGRNLKIAPQVRSAGKVEEFSSEPFELNGDSLVISAADPKRHQEMKRLNGSTTSSKSIIGTWGFKHYTGQSATMQFTTVGLAHLSVPLSSEIGSFEQQGDQLSLQFGAGPTTRLTIKLEGDHLVVITPGGKDREEFSRIVP